MSKKIEIAEKKVNFLKSKEKCLIQALGKDKFGRVVSAISKIIKEECLDTTPTILEDTLDYLLKINL
ncbi:hypothetical protein [Clostridium botulinum]|uniref:hypothetical protein n=1 Tax=Clostridium botulinum TaxID=1491 RepID=UPI00059E4C20|nr:hypothetical protein [Clostridium botulinum]KIN81952.1 hypothetical protein SD74_07230 [Clostridium botulinum]MCC5428177.1 hypothetical protein [Clostridium botulinum]